TGCKTGSVRIIICNQLQNAIVFVESQGMLSMTDHVLKCGNIEITSETFGELSHPPVLLIMGGMASMLWWPEEFCRRLAQCGRLVIRYDQRDTGLSTKYPPGEPGYTFD